MNYFKKSVWVCFVLISLSLTACAANNDKDEEKQLNEMGNPSEENTNMKLDLGTLFKDAEQGRLAESPFTIGNTMIDAVKQEWGMPEKVDEAGYGFYANYPLKKVAIGYNRDGEIFDLRSYDERLQEFTSSMIVAAFGVPSEIRNNDGEDIYIYELDSGYELKIIIAKEENTVDHISVFYPERTVVSSQESKKSYSLDIRGNSNQLAVAAWNSMQDWRKEMVLFAKENENMFIHGPDRRKVALTFDDGPDEAITQGVIDILEKYQVKGNFFFLGSKVEEYPQVVSNAYRNGHLILSHSYHHVDLMTLSTKEVIAEIDQAGKAIKSVIGKEPAIIRPPYGATNEQVAKISEQLGYSIVLWSIDTLDWSQKEANNIAKNVVSNIRNGDIILMHSNEDKSETLKALPVIIEALQEQNFEIVDLKELLGIEAYQ